MRRGRRIAIGGLLLTLWSLHPGARAADEVPVAHVHEGSCAALGAVAYELDPPMPGMSMDMGSTPTPDGMSGMAGTAVPTPVLVSSADGSTVVSETEVDASIAKLTGGGYAVNVHAGMSAILDSVACVDLATATTVGSDAVAPLLERNDSGWSGFVVLRPLAKGGGTEIDLYLNRSPVPGTPAA